MSIQDLLSKASGITPTTSPGVPSGTSTKGIAGLASKVTFNTSEKVLTAQKEAVDAERASKVANSKTTIAKETVKSIGSIIPDYFKNLNQAYSVVPGKIKTNIQEGAKDIQAGNSAKGQIKVGFRTAGDALDAIFAPITVAIGTVLERTGGQKIIDKAGNTIADSSGITDLESFQKFAMTHPNAGEDFSRFLNLALAPFEKGKIASKESIQQAANLFAKKAVPEPTAIQKIIARSELPTEQTIPVKTPMTKLAEYSKSQGYEPYTSVDNLPTIQMGKKSSGNLPTVQTEVKPRTKTGELTLEPIQQKASVAKAPVPETARPIPMNENVSRTSLKIQEEARAKGIEADFSQVPEIQRMNLAEEAVKAKKFIDENLSEAIKVIDRGDIGLRDQSVFIELKKKAILEGNGDLSKKLAESKIGTEASQALKALDDGMRLSADPVKAIQEIQKVRQEVSKSKLLSRDAVKEKQKIADRFQKELQIEKTKTAPTKQTWSEFISSIEC